MTGTESILAYTTNSEDVVQIAIFSIGMVVGLIIIIFFQIVILRIILIIRNRRYEKFINLWRPIIMESLAVPIDNAPKLKPRHAKYFMLEWNSLYDKLGRGSQGNLVQFASSIGINKYASYLLIARQPKDRITGIITLGHLRITGLWDILKAIAENETLVLSLASFRALLHIDSVRALGELFPLIIKRDDWPISMVAKILKEVENTSICSYLVSSALENDGADLSRVIQLMDVLQCASFGKVFSQLLAKEQSSQVISLCMQALRDPQYLSMVKDYATHQDAGVRISVASALGRLGTKQDIELLISLLLDDDWWVRYRAAQSLSKFPFVDKTQFLEIEQRIDNQNTKDIMQQVLAEWDIL